MERGNEGGAIEHADADSAQNNPPGAGEHAVVHVLGAAEHAVVHVLLRPADLPDLQRDNRRNKQSLHDEARELLNLLTRRHTLEPVDLNDLWPN